MSIWKLGIDDVSEEAQAFKDKLSSKDGHIAAQETQLLRQAIEFEELKLSLNDALHKLSIETQRALQLETELNRRSEDLREEKIVVQNIQSALVAADGKIKAKDLEIRDLQATLESLSYTSGERQAYSVKLDREKRILEQRVRELDANIRQLTVPPTTPRQHISRPRSSSLSNFRIISLEQDLGDTRNSLSQKESELRCANQKLSQVQNELMRLDNEKGAIERKLRAQLKQLQGSLEEKEEELIFLREQQGDGGREEELLKRIDEDDAKITALEAMLRNAQDLMTGKDLLRHTEMQLKEERHKLEECLEREITLIQEKEEALNNLDDVRQKLSRVEELLSGTDNNDWKDRVTISCDVYDGTSLSQVSCSLDTNSSHPAHRPAPVPHPNYDETTVVYVERLLRAVDRLRGERDNLRRDVQFLESESKFAIEALEAKLSASMSSVCDESVATIGQMKSEMDGLYTQLSEMNQRQLAVVRRKDEEVRRLALATTASLLIVGKLSSSNDHLQDRFDEARTAVTNAEQQLNHGGEAFLESEARFKEMENKLHVVVLCLEAMTCQRDDLKAELETKDREWQQEFGAVKLAQQERRNKLEEVTCQLTDLTKQLEDVESERDSLTLQVTNLMTDLNTAQQELANAESRYSSLQFHQLSSMTSNEANRALRDQIEELEMRVMRRTEQIGLQQHDIRRLETNLRLQEERLAEMTMELEMLAAQKDAMVEDCADAREARDRALSQGEALEEEMENMEVKMQEGEESVRLLIGVVFETVSNARQTILRAEKEFREDQKQLTIALAVSQVEHAGVADFIDRVRHENSQLNLWTTSLEDQLRKTDAALASLSSDLNVALQDSSRLASEFAVRSSELEAEICRLQSVIATQEKGHQAALIDLHDRHENVQKRMQEGESPSNSRDSSSQDLERQHANEIAALQLRLADVTAALTELRSLQQSAESSNKKAIEEAEKERSHLETQIVATKDELLASREREKELKRHHEEICLLLRTELEQMAQKATESQETQLGLQLENERVNAQLSLVRQENIAAAAQAQDRFALTLSQLECHKLKLQEQLQEATCQLERSTQQTAQLFLRLQEDKEKMNKDREQQAAQMLLATERQEQADAELLHVEEDLKILKEKLGQAELHCRSVEDEKLVFLEQTTTMKAEIQRLLSLTRFLENQVKESERIQMSLSEILERVRSELERSEKSGNTAIVNLTLQSAQHKREMAEIKRELTILQSRPNLEHVVAQLEERSNEMEELLRSKCAEIEENDDRSLEMLKENKKLHARVESLTRKIQSLQTKLASLKAMTPNSTEGSSRGVFTEATGPPRAGATRLSSPQTPNPTSRLATTPSNRFVSGPSSLPRPKTPERRTTQTPVFKARTPERIPLPTVEPLPSTTIIGRKRRAPDDFEVCESLPPQAFKADSTPEAEIENRTPRVRRVLNTFQSGFTPLRHHPNRPIIPIPSPKRSDKGTSQFSLVISDLTNNPRDVSLPLFAQAAKPTKRSWLGKIRGVSTQESLERQ